MTTAAALPNGMSREQATALREWDWQAALRAEERTKTWLARQTGKAQTTVYGYAYGQQEPPLEWLKSAAAVLHSELAG